MVDMNDILRINQLIHIEYTDERGFSNRYPSRIECIDSKQISLASPIKDNKTMYIPNGESINVWFWDNEAIYTFKTIVVNNVLEGIPQIIVNGAEKVERVQKREYVRVSMHIDVNMFYTDEDSNIQNIWCNSRDISGGGIMLVITKAIKLNSDSMVFLEFYVDEQKIRTAVEIVWNDWEIDSEGIERNIIGLKFVTISDNDRQLIIKKVYLKQIELRRKGLL